MVLYASAKTDSYDSHVVFDHAVSLEEASRRERFEAVARALRDLLTQRRLLTEQTYERVDAKRVYYLFAGKAAPAYTLAKLIIRLINEVGATIDADPSVRQKLKVVFVSNYSVTLAERLTPASDVSEQISTAGYEASGTGNMKFMMNGALTIGTRDGATIEMAEEAGEQNFFLFGLTASEVANSRGRYDPKVHYDNEPATRAALYLIFTDHFSRSEPGVFEPIREALLTHGDYFMHLAGLSAYAQAQDALGLTYRNTASWTRKAIANVGCSGKFSSDRTIAEYVADIWKVTQVPVNP